MVFQSDRQRRAFFATGNFARSPMTPQPSAVTKRQAFSYRDGRSLGRFDSLQAVFKRFPSERKAFQRVMKFNRMTGKRVTNIEQIKKEKRRMNVNRRWDR